MAKKKKMTYDEMLVDAQDVQDKPYELPDGWCWVKLGALFNITSSKRVLKRDWMNEGVPFLRTRELVALAKGEEFKSPLFIKESMYDDYKECYGIPVTDDILVSGVGTVGISYVVKDNDKFYFKDGNVIWLQNWSKTNAIYINYLYNTVFMQNQIIGMSAGTTVDTYTIRNAKKTVIPLPPLAEQQRLVDKIESMFTKLNSAKELIEEVLAEFENRRSAILHKAFTGELTKVWREENGYRLEDWDDSTFSKSVKVKSNLVNPIEYLSYPHIAPNNIEKGTGKLLDYKTIGDDGVKSGKHKFYSGQILYSKIRPYLSKVVIVDFDGLCSADMYPVEWEHNNKFLYYYMLTDEFVKKASTAGSRSVLPKINQKELGRISICIPKIDEQNEIVRILDNLLEKEDQAKELVSLLDEIEIMKKSILARAFRGELDTYRDGDGTGMELLERICRERSES